MKDAVATMGNLLPDDAGGRDAVHVAVFSAYADERVFPGQHVSLMDRGGTDQIVGTEKPFIGIIDPFITSAVLPGERFWVYLYPRTITALSHRWSHPAFEDTGAVYVPPADKLRSEEWLRDFAEELISYVLEDGDTKYDIMMRHVSEGPDGSDTFGFGTDINVRDVPAGFWSHVEIVVGKRFSGPLSIYFRCAC